MKHVVAAVEAGFLRGRHVGEVHSGEEGARELETAIEGLLAKTLPDCGPEWNAVKFALESAQPGP